MLRRAACLVIRSGLAHLLCTIFRYGAIVDSTGYRLVRSGSKAPTYLQQRASICVRRLCCLIAWESTARLALLHTGWGWVISSSTRPLVSTTTRMSAPNHAGTVPINRSFGSVYEEELHIHVERGRVTGTRVYDNRGKDIDTRRLGVANLPGRENRFPGDRDFN